MIYCIKRDYALNNIIGFIFISSFLLLFSSNIFAEKLYKWKDKSDKWHYSRIPPNAESKVNLPKVMEAAKDTKIIIFAPDTSVTVNMDEQAILRQKQLQLRLNCQSAQTSMMSTAKYLHQVTDKNFQEKKVTLDEYNKEKQDINKLEEIASDVNYYNYCMGEFLERPQLKSITNCILEQDSFEGKSTCLKEIPHN